MTRDEFDLRIADLFNIPPHFLGTGLPEHRRTWRLRRRIRIIKRWLRS